MKRKGEINMKILKFHQIYNGRYAESESYTIYPKEAEGSIFKDIKGGEGLIFLGELEGKHSECYGNLTISEIDTEDLSIEELEDLVENSDLDDFEGLFEESNYEFTEWVKTLEGTDELSEIILKRKEMRDFLKIDLDPEKFDWREIGNVNEAFIVKLKEKIAAEKSKLPQVISIKLNEQDKEKALKVLNENGIEVL